MRRTVLTTALLALALCAGAQNYASGTYAFGASASTVGLAGVPQSFGAILAQIDGNNTTLKALRDKVDADQLDARTGINPSDPEVELGYLWGDSPSTGNRLDINVKQSFDFPSAYYWRKKLSEGQCSIAEMEYAIGRKDILFEAEQTLIKLVYVNAMLRELKRCDDNMKSIADGWQARFDAGNASLLDLNKAKITKLQTAKDLAEMMVEKEDLLAELERLNGEEPIRFDVDVFDPVLIPEKFEVWYNEEVMSSPELLSFDAQINSARAASRLAASESLPKISLGYVSERILGTTLQGIEGGISIPLWENRNKVRAAKARTAAALSQAEDAARQYFNRLKIKHSKAIRMQLVADSYRDAFNSSNNIDLARQALEAGSINLLDYITEADIWYEALASALETERDAQLIASELRWMR